MDRSRLNEWLTVATNIAVVAGIIFLAIELRQNSAALRSNVLQAVSSESSPLNLALAADDTMRETWLQGLKAPESLSESQRLQFNVTLHVWFSNAQNWFHQVQNGVLDEDIADGHWTTMATMHHIFPGFRDYWETRKYTYTPAFRSFVEGEVFSREPLENFQGPDIDEPNLPAETARITAQLDAIYKLSTADGEVEEIAEKQLRFFAKTPSIIRPNQAPLIGREAVADFYRNVFGSMKVLENSYTDLVVVIEGETATRRYVGTGVFITTDISEPQTTANQMFDVLVKEDGKWKTLVHSWAPLSN